jgi:hypothetical protein
LDVIQIGIIIEKVGLKIDRAEKIHWKAGGGLMIQLKRRRDCMSRCIVLALALLVSLCAFGILVPASAGDWSEPFEGYYLFLGDKPHVESTWWSGDINGIAHDDNNWYVADQKVFWKIPVSCNLALLDYLHCDLFNGTCNVCPEIQHNAISLIPELSNAGYDHFGDLDYYSYNGEGYLIIPVENGPFPCIAFFYASNLSFAAYAYLYYQEGHAPWCAINHANGTIYSSAFDDTGFKKYRLNWEQVSSANRGLIALDLPEVTLFRNSQGDPISLGSIQGGELTDSDRLFYLLSGYVKGSSPYDGICVFDVSTGNMVSHSTIGVDPFNFEFYPGPSSHGEADYEEPEGLTIWDLDSKPSGSTGGITGQLHVVLLNSYDGPFATAEVYLKHYSNIITIDSTYSGTENGRPSTPLKTIGSANVMINDFSWGTTNFGWNGSRIKIRAGTYPESYAGPIAFSKQVQLFTEGGTAHIRDRVTLSSNGSINLGREGKFTIY